MSDTERIGSKTRPREVTQKIVAWGILLTGLVAACSQMRPGGEVASKVAVAPSLGTAEAFSVLGASAVTNTGPTVLSGDLGVSPGTAITGFPPGTVLGTTHSADAVALQAQSDATTAYDDLAGQACDSTFGVPTDIGGSTLTPGVYCFSDSAQITGTLTLDAGGDPNAVFVFKIASTLTTASNSNVLLVNGATACGVFWQVGSSATIGTGTDFVGTIIALTSITVTTDATIEGRALARNGAVTLDSNVVTTPTCGATPSPSPSPSATVSPVPTGTATPVPTGTATPVPTATPGVPPELGKEFTPGTIGNGGVSTITIKLHNVGNSAPAEMTAPLTDTLPSGMVVVGNASTTCGGVLTANPGDSRITLTGGVIPANDCCEVTVDVTAPTGSFCNKLAVGALQTTNGSNQTQAKATLTVTAD